MEERELELQKAQRQNQRNKMTEKNYNSEQKTSKTMKKQKKVKQKVEVAEIKKSEIKQEKPKETNKETEKKVEDKKKKKVEKVKKEKAIVNGVSLPVSTKYAVAICRFINKKAIGKAITDLEEVSRLKKSIPMKGEIPHRKGKGMMSGRYPIKAVSYFIKMLKTLGANSNMNGIEEPIIVEAIANKASRPYGRFGAVKRKRTHIKIVAKEKNKIKEKK